MTRKPKDRSGAAALFFDFFVTARSDETFRVSAALMVTNMSSTGRDKKCHGF